MKNKIALFFIMILSVVLTACKAETPNPAEDSLIEVVNLQITPELSHWLPHVAACADGIPNIGIYTQTLPWTELTPDRADLVVRLGAKLESDPFTVVLGTEQIAIIAGSEVPLSSLSVDNLRGLYSGDFSNWNEVDEVTAAGIEINQPVQTLTYPEGNALRRLFRESYLETEAIHSEARVFSTVDYAVTLLQNDPYAIGYLLKSQVPAGIQTLSINGVDPDSAQHFVLGVTSQEPHGSLRQLLLCLQESY